MTKESPVIPWMPFCAEDMQTSTFISSAEKGIMA